MPLYPAVTYCNVYAATEAFGIISGCFHVKVSSDPAVDSPGLVRTRNLDIISLSSLVTSDDVSAPIFQPSTADNCWLSRARGGGDAGSLTPRCSATPIRCMRWRVSTVTCVIHLVRTTTTTSRSCYLCYLLCVAFVGTLSVTTSDRDLGSSAWRRQRRLRSMLRHERQSIAMALAEALHHSSGPSTKKVVDRHEGSEEVEYETHNAPRGQNTPLSGMRPTPLAEVAGPQEVAATVGYVAAGAPLWSAVARCCRDRRHSQPRCSDPPQDHTQEKERGDGEGEAGGGGGGGGQGSRAVGPQAQRRWLLHDAEEKEEEEASQNLFHSRRSHSETWTFLSTAPSFLASCSCVCSVRQWLNGHASVLEAFDICLGFPRVSGLGS